jgi:hypothetical protein
MEEGAMSQGQKKSLETEKGKEVDPSLEHPASRRNTFYQFSFGADSDRCKIIHWCFLSHEVCYYLLYKQQENNRTS